MIRVQSEDFDPGAEIARLSGLGPATGAVASFLGLVRGDDDLVAMTLEHYPGMTERQLASIEEEARRRWKLLDVSIIHRFGRLLPGDRIVLMVVASSHRGEAFAACEFLMDWLKTKAPFWKLEERSGHEDWVAAKSDDEQRSDRW